jgi:SAM-dependent methyltransferase
MEDLELLVDLHLPGERQGPGGERETRLALELSGLRGRSGLRVADLGCGTGASTLVLARELDARITAVDFLPAFLRELEGRAERAGLASRIETLEASIDALPFAERSLDAIWSEGAIYNVGFAAGVEAWARFLRPGGVLAVSELTWLTVERPAELERHWNEEYPEVATAAEKLAVLEAHGFTPVGYFPLPERCWSEGYHGPLRERFEAFLERHGRSAAARRVVAAEEAEIELHERHPAHVSYGFYVARLAAGA